MEKINVDVAVVGGGPAGLAAALAAKKEGVSVLIIERDFELGGILQQCIHNGFGLRYFKEELTGPEYAQRFINMLDNSGIQVLLKTMVIDLNEDRLITAINQQKGVIQIQAKSVVLAMGCRERTRGAINTPGTRPAGIFPAGQAQRLMNMEGYKVGHRVVILGSGDIGMIMARRMTLEGAKVLCVSEILPYASGLVRNQVQCLQDYGIPLYLKHTITSIEGNERVQAVTISEVDENWFPIPGTEKRFECDTILFSVGLIPENEISQKAGIKIARNGGPVVNEYYETSVPGIFSCGNVLQVHDLVDWVTLEGERAGYYAALNAQGKLAKKTLRKIKTVAGENVLYIKPDIIENLDEDKEIQFSFRPRKPAENVQINFISKDHVINRRKKKYVIPSEMEIIKVRLKVAEIGDEIKIEIVMQGGF